MVVARMSVSRPLKTTYSRSLPIPRVGSVNLMRTRLENTRKSISQAAS